jgi:hypothetical protein
MSAPATPRRPAETIAVSPRHHHRQSRRQSIFPTSRAMSKIIVAFAIPDDQQTPRPVRAALSEHARS